MCSCREKYLTASTYLSSRAFPSSLLSSTPTLVHSPGTKPILIPGVDSLNHARGHSVSWLVTLKDTKPPSSTAKITLVHHPSAVKDQELFNNYGLKPNAELILGYGFSLQNNPDDTIVLKIGGIQGGKWEVGRNSQGAEGLWKEILNSFVEDGSEETTYEDILDASGMLQEMVEGLIARLPEAKISETSQARPEVVQMFQDYLEGDYLRLPKHYVY